ncbi:hypothetical protein RFEPED_1055 [Rickettsia felis str. Pedreira]|uniref:Uncharacterized protein n=1 Tax=Rickettsia felis str. Pedreira TaxID=1359196 RepID=A0A0F3MVT0_RICFI|nr:hypothetical protein RFEPED_1055 [Rickettsia felis str. Pedreira]
MWHLHSAGAVALLYGSFFRHCEKNYIVIRRSNPVKNSDLQNFFIIFSRLPRRFAPRKALLCRPVNALYVIPAKAGIQKKSINT